MQQIFAGMRCRGSLILMRLAILLSTFNFSLREKSLARVSQKLDLTIDASSDIRLKMFRGELNAQMAFLTRNYKVKGAMGLMMKIGKLFNTALAEEHYANQH